MNEGLGQPVADADLSEAERVERAAGSGSESQSDAQQRSVGSRHATTGSREGRREHGRIEIGTAGVRGRKTWRSAAAKSARSSDKQRPFQARSRCTRGAPVDGAKERHASAHAGLSVAIRSFLSVDTGEGGAAACVVGRARDTAVRGRARSAHATGCRILDRLMPDIGDSCRMCCRETARAIG